jgi:guanylate kinase
MQELGHPFRFLVTATTRPRRESETDGVDYHFLSESEFQRMIDEGEFLEYALVYGQYKGVPKAYAREALAAGQDVVMRVDVQGAATVRRLVPQAVLVFLLTASEEELVDRLRRRGTESLEELDLRIDMLREEVARSNEFDYIVVNPNGKLDEAVEHIVSIVRAEKCRVCQRPKVVL